MCASATEQRQIGAKSNEPQFRQCGNSAQLKVGSLILKETGHILIPTSRMNATDLTSCLAADMLSSSLSRLFYRYKSSFVFLVFLVFGSCFHPAFPHRHSCPRRWIRPVPSSPPRPSSPPTSCWPSNPKRSRFWPVESTVSCQGRVGDPTSFNRANKLKRKKDMLLSRPVLYH